MKKYSLILLLLCSFSVCAQYNCEAFKAMGDTCKYEACKYIENSRGYFQLRKEYHDKYNKALEICPDYHPAYKAKSTAYLKTGDFITWKKLMDKAVELSPKDHLDYRGWCRFQFFRDYQGAIDDIERLQKLVGSDLGFGQNGMYHLTTMLALCYKMLGNSAKAIQLLEDHLSDENKVTGWYIRYHLGVLYYENGSYDKAQNLFNEQTKEYSFAENEYYKSLVYKKQNQPKKQREALQKSLKLYQDGVFMNDVYAHQVDKVYLIEIQEELTKLYQD